MWIIVSIMTAATLTGWLAVVRWVLRSMDGIERRFNERVSHHHRHVMALVSADMLKAATDDPHGTVTLDFATDSGTIRVAIPRDRWVTVFGGIRMTQSGVRHDGETWLLLESQRDATLPEHWHWERFEECHVTRGTVTDESTGDRYVAGQVWHIPAFRRHAVTFDNAHVLLRYRPPLPTAAEQPPDLSGVSSVLSGIGESCN